MNKFARNLSLILISQFILSSSYAEDMTRAKIYDEMHKSIYGSVAAPASAGSTGTQANQHFLGDKLVEGQAQPWTCKKDDSLGNCAIQSERFVTDMCGKATTTWVKDADKWGWWQIGFTVVGVGATVAAASALATAKLWGVLAGSTGLAASMNTIATNDVSIYQANLTSIKTTQASFTTYANNTKVPTDEQLQVEAISAAGNCLMATQVAVPAK